MIRAGRIAGRRTDPAISLADQVFAAERPPFAVPPLLARLLVQQLGEGLRQPVGQGLRHDRVVVVVLLLEALADRLNANSARDRERADVILEARGLRRDEISQRVIELVRRLWYLLAERMKGRQYRRTRFVAVHLDVVAHAVGREKAVHRP